MRLIIETQYLENYGAHDWSGEGDCPQYWKPKFGSEYELAVSNTDISEASSLETLVNLHRDQMEQDTNYSREYVINWYVLGDTELTSQEQDYLEFEGNLDHGRPIKLQDKRGSLYDLI